MQHQRTAACFLLVLFSAAAAGAQGLGLGARLSMVRGDVNANPSTTSQRFLGGQVRARLSPKSAVEVSLERRVENPGAATRVTDYPLQGSLLLYPIRSSFSPYVLGGIGWYTHVVELLSPTAEPIDRDASRKMGYHAGFGAEMMFGRHAAVHADYRYTMIHFGDSTGGTSGGTTGLVNNFKPSYDGSMWTAGFTFYF